jgi:hypothetical protein
VFARYRANPPDVIVLSSRNTAPATRDPAGWLAGMARGFTLLPPTSKVIVVGESPANAVPPPRCLALHPRDAAHCDASYNLDVNTRLQAAVKGKATFVDLRPVFCANERCPAISNGLLIWADDHHITIQFAESLSRWFAGIVAPLLPS